MSAHETGRLELTDTSAQSHTSMNALHILKLMCVTAHEIGSFKLTGTSAQSQTSMKALHILELMCVTAHEIGRNQCAEKFLTA